MAIEEVGPRRKSPATTIGEEEGDHDDVRETLRTPENNSYVKR